MDGGSCHDKHYRLRFVANKLDSSGQLGIDGALIRVGMARTVVVPAGPVGET